MKKYSYIAVSSVAALLIIGIFFGVKNLKSNNQLITLKSTDDKTLKISLHVAERFLELKPRIKRGGKEFVLPYDASTIEAVINLSGVPLELIGVGLSQIIKITQRANIDDISAMTKPTEVNDRVQSIVKCAEFLIAPKRVYTWLGRILMYDKIRWPDRFWRHVNVETIKNDVARIAYLLEGKVTKRLKNNRALGFSIEGLIRYKRLKVSIKPQEDRPREPILVLKNNFINRLDGLNLLKFKFDDALVEDQDFVFLDLSHNRLSHIKPEDFAGFKLKGLKLSANILANISKKSADELATLKVLNLAYNKIENLPLEGFSSLGSLLNLRLSENKISELNEKSFGGLSSMQDLDLGYNIIKKIGPRTFESVRNVNELFLDNNELTDQSFNTDDLLVFEKLEEIDLQVNQFSEQHKKRLKNTLKFKYPDIKIKL